MPRNGQLRTVLLVVAIALAAFLAYRQYDRITGKSEQIWVATTPLLPGDVVGGRSIELRRVKAAEVPQTALRNEGAILGRPLAGPKAPGEPFRETDFEPAEPQIPLAAQVPEGRVLYTMNLYDVRVPYRNLVGGDRLEVIAVEAGETESTARVVAHDAIMMGYSSGISTARAQERGGLLSQASAMAPPTQVGVPALLLALRPDDVFPLTEVRPGEKVRIILHGRNEVDRGQLLPLLPAVPTTTVELIVGTRKEQVVLR